MAIVGKKEKKQQPSMMDRANQFMNTVNQFDRMSKAGKASQLAPSEQTVSAVAPDEFAERQAQLYKSKKSNPYRR